MNMNFTKISLKCFVCIIMVAAMILTMSTSIFARSVVIPDEIRDVVGHTNEEALFMLNQLDILTPGWGWSGLYPEQTVSRAEFAVQLIRILGIGPVEGSSFVDVTEHWASGYINAAHAVGIAQENEVMTFSPDVPILYEQAIAMLLRAMGYLHIVETRGGFPLGYVITANGLNLGRNIGGLGATLTRGMMAQLIYDALDIPLVEAISFEAGGAVFRQVLSGDATLLTTYLRLERHAVRITDMGTRSDNPNRIEVEFLDARGEATGRTDTLFLAPRLLSTVRRNTIIGTTAVVFMDPITRVVETIWSDSEVVFDWIYLMNDRYFPVPAPLDEPLRTITLKNSGVRYNMYRNNFSLTLDGVDITNSPSDAVGAFAKIILNRNGEIVSVIAQSLDVSPHGMHRTWGLVERISGGSLIYRNHLQDELSIDELDLIENLLILLNGEEVELGDLTRDMFFDFIRNRENDSAMLLVSDRTVNDEIEALTDTTIFVEGIEYDISTQSFVVSLDSGRTYQNSMAGVLTGRNANMTLDMRGDIRILVTDVGANDTGFYGVVINAATHPFATPEITILREFNGRERRATYPVRIRQTVSTTPGVRVSSYEELIDIIWAGNTGSTDGERMQNIAMSRVFWFELEGGRITEIIRPEWISYQPSDYLFRGRNLLHELEPELRNSGPKAGGIPGVSWLTGPRVHGGLFATTQSNFHFDVAKRFLNSGGNLAEQRTAINITNDTVFFSLFNASGQFDPTFVDWNTVTFGGNYGQESFPEASLMIEGRDFSTFAESGARPHPYNVPANRTTNLVLFVEGIDNIIHNTGRAGLSHDTMALVGPDRFRTRIFDDIREEERTFTLFNVTTRFGWGSPIVSHDLYLPEGMLGRDMFEAIINGLGASAPLIELADLEASGRNTLVDVRGFHPNQNSEEARRNIVVSNIFNLDRLTPPGTNLADNFGFEIVERIRDVHFFYTSETGNGMQVLSNARLILEYNPFNSNEHYTVSELRFIQPGDRVFFIRGTQEPTWGLHPGHPYHIAQGNVRAVIFQRQENIR